MRRFQLSLPGLVASVELSRESELAKRERLVSQFRENNIYFEGPYPSWSDAKASAQGYDSPQILQKAISSALRVSRGEVAYERDTVTSSEREFEHSLMAWLLFAASRSSSALRVLDFGGALGSLYFQHRGVLGHLPDLKWCVVEQPNFVTAGTNQFADETLSFFTKVEDAVEAFQPNVLLLSAVLQYLDDPHAVLKSLLAMGIEYVLIDRTMAQYEQPERAYIQHVPEWIYPASYPVWFVDANRIENAFRDNGYKVIECLRPNGEFGTGLPAHLNALVAQDPHADGQNLVGPWPYRGWFASKGGEL